jgi:protein TonB
MPNPAPQKERKNHLPWLLAGLVVAAGAYFGISRLQVTEAPAPAAPVVEVAAPVAEPTPAPLPEPKPAAQPVAKKEEAPKKEKAAKKAKPKEPEEEVVIIADEPAQPAGGYEAFYKYIKQNLKYPEAARQQKAEGKVILQFLVKKDGSLSKVKVQKGIGHGCDEEAIRVVKAGEAWQPAKNKGMAVTQQVVMPINFRLN